jgi:hypothetical protein
MIRISSLAFAAVVMFGVAACTPKPAEDASTNPATAANTPEMRAQAAAAAAALRAGLANDPNMTPEERAKAEKVLGNIASGNVDPAASAYLTGLNKVMVIIGSVKDEAAIPGAKAQLAPIFAEMKPAADKLSAMSKDDRDVAMGSAAPQIMQVSMQMAASLMPLAMSNPKLSDEIGKLLDGMPDIKD